MHKLRIIHIIVMCVLFLPVWTRGDEHDSQVWLDQSLGHDVSEKYTLLADQSLRFKQNASNFDTYTILVGLQRHALSWIEHGYYVRYQLDRVGDVSMDELRPTYDLVLKWYWGLTRWSNRSRFEYRFRESREDMFRYRNRLKLVFQEQLTVFDLKPYGAIELFLEDGEFNFGDEGISGQVGIQTESDGYIRNIEFKKERRFTKDLYLRYLRSEIPGGYFNEYILGFKFGFFF